MATTHTADLYEGYAEVKGWTGQDSAVEFPFFDHLAMLVDLGGHALQDRRGGEALVGLQDAGDAGMQLAPPAAQQVPKVGF